MLIQYANQHVNASVSKRQPTCRFNTQPKRQWISKRQATCRFNTPTNTPMHQSININQLVDSIQKKIVHGASLHSILIQHNQHVKTCVVYWVRSIRI